MNTHRQEPTQMITQRKIAVVVGVLYLITHVTSVGAAALYAPILGNSDFVIGNGAITPVLLGVLFEIILAMANIGTAVALFPVVKRWGEIIALGYIGLRTLEGAVIAVGVLPLMVVVILRQAAEATTTDPVTLLTISSALVPVYKATLVVGPGFICSINTVLMATLMYRSRLVPRFIPVLGLMGGPLIFVFTAVRMFGNYDQLPDWAGVAVIPIFAWELTLAVYLIARGFRASATSSASANPDASTAVNTASQMASV